MKSYSYATDILILFTYFENIDSIIHTLFLKMITEIWAFFLIVLILLMVLNFRYLIISNNY